MKGCSVHRESVARWKAMLGRRVLLAAWRENRRDDLVATEKFAIGASP